MLRISAMLPLLLAAGCRLFEEEKFTEDRDCSPWYELPAVKLAHPEVARKIREAMFRQGYTVRALDEAPREILSDWNTTLRPYKDEGHRERVEARLTRVADGVAVAVRSRREYNANVRSPLSPELAEWRKAGLSELHVLDIDPPGQRLFQSVKTSLLAVARD
jgi:hypothetical protein